MAAVTVAACATTAAVPALASSSSCDESSDDGGATTAAEMTSSSPAVPQECAVCLSELAVTGGVGSSDAEPPAVRTLPVCGHGFHAECIGRWLPLRPECPLCRRPAPLEDHGARGQPDARAVAAASPAGAALAWARPPGIACSFGDGRVVWTRSPSVRE